MTDGSQPLDPKRENFIKWLLEGKSAAEAYRKGHPKSNQRTCEKEGSLMQLEPDVSRRFRWFQKKAETATVLTQSEKRERLASIVRGEEETRDILSAIKIDNEMDPDSEPTKLQVSGTLTVGEAIKSLMHGRNPDSKRLAGGS